MYNMNVALRVENIKWAIQIFMDIHPPLLFVFQLMIQYPLTSNQSIGNIHLLFPLHQQASKLQPKHVASIDVPVFDYQPMTAEDSRRDD